MIRTRSAGLLLAALSLSVGCASDGAVRLARCFEREAKILGASADTTVLSSCDLGVENPGGALVVVFPDGPISSAQLAAVGLDRDQINTVSRLQIGDTPMERINVLPGTRRPRPSRTTYHRRFVRTPELLACELEGSKVDFTLRKDGRRIELVGLSSD